MEQHIAWCASEEIWVEPSPPCELHTVRESQTAEQIAHVTPNRSDRDTHPETYFLVGVSFRHELKGLPLSSGQPSHVPITPVGDDDKPLHYLTSVFCGTLSPSRVTKYVFLKPPKVCRIHTSFSTLSPVDLPGTRL